MDFEFTKQEGDIGAVTSGSSGCPVKMSGPGRSFE